MPPFASAAKFPVKRRGEIAELAFLLKAISLGFGVAKPWGDSDRFDFILHCEGRLWRVQVKSAWCGPPYQIKGTGFGNRPYTAADLDFVAAYIIPRDLWYILPLAVLGSRKILNIYPDTRTSPFNDYRDAWGLFQNPSRWERVDNFATRRWRDVVGKSTITSLVVRRRPLRRDVVVAQTLSVVGSRLSAKAKPRAIVKAQPMWGGLCGAGALARQRPSEARVCIRARL